MQEGLDDSNCWSLESCVPTSMCQVWIRTKARTAGLYVSSPVLLPTTEVCKGEVIVHRCPIK